MAESRTRGHSIELVQQPGNDRWVQAHLQVANAFKHRDRYVGHDLGTLWVDDVVLRREGNLEKPAHGG